MSTTLVHDTCSRNLRLGESAMMDPSEQMEHDAADFSLHESKPEADTKAQFDMQEFNREMDARFAAIETSIGVLWKTIEHGPAVIGYLTTVELEWYSEFVEPKLRSWGRL